MAGALSMVRPVLGQATDDKDDDEGEDESENGAGAGS